MCELAASATTIEKQSKMNTLAKLRRQLNETNCTLALLYPPRALSVLHFELLTSRIESIVQLQWGWSSFANDLFPIFALSLCFPVHPLLMESSKRSLLAAEDRKLLQLRDRLDICYVGI